MPAGGTHSILDLGQSIIIQATAMSPTSTPVRAARFPVLEKQAPAVFIDSAEKGDGAALLGKLLDMSIGGAKVLSDAPLRFQQAVTLRVESDELDLHLSLAARVCWIRSSGDHWRLGFSFEPPLDNEHIDRLLAQGVLDRRRNARDAIDRPATALWELNPKPTPVTIVDLSQGGFCLRAPLPAEPHSRLRLQLAGAGDEVLETTATVQWRLEVPDGYLLGCSLANLETSVLLRNALITAPPPTRTRSLRRKIAWCVLLAAAACVVVALLL
jgi:hypothetical protein